jgi:hypothetical protein
VEEIFLVNKVNKSGSSRGIASIFIIAGVFFIIISFLFEMQIAAFIGLGFTFWGAIFTITRKGKYVEGSLLDSSAKTAYSTIDRMINDFKYITSAYFIPSYSQDIHLPDYLNNLKEPIVYLSDGFSGTPSVEEIIAGKFVSEKKRGIFITSPGSGLMAQMERQMQVDFSKVNLQELCTLIPRCLNEYYNLTKTLEMEVLDKGVTLKATGVLYESFYSSKPLRSVNLLGCPIVNAVACALAKNYGKTVTIQKQVISPDNFGVEVIFNFMQG